MFLQFHELMGINETMVRKKKQTSPEIFPGHKIHHLSKDGGKKAQFSMIRNRQTYGQKYIYINTLEKIEAASQLFDVTLSWE